MTIIPDLETAIVMTIPFLVTYAALNFILFRPLFAYLQERERIVHEAKHETHELEGRIEQQTGALELKLRSAREEAMAVRAQARLVAHAEEAAIISKARAEADAQLEAAMASIAIEQTAASKALAISATDLSADIARQVLGREVRA